MAIKKSEIYSQIWAACDKLRGGVEPARYKDYILTLLFVKYEHFRYKKGHQKYVHSCSAARWESSNYCTALC